MTLSVGHPVMVVSPLLLWCIFSWRVKLVPPGRWLAVLDAAGCGICASGSMTDFTSSVGVVMVGSVEVVVAYAEQQLSTAWASVVFLPLLIAFLIPCHRRIEHVVLATRILKINRRSVGNVVSFTPATSTHPLFQNIFLSYPF